MTTELILQSVNPPAPRPANLSLRLQILGPLRLWHGDTELDAGPRQQAYLLGLLLARGGRPTSPDELIDLIWGDNAPASALNVLHKYVGAIRRTLEPTVAPRGAGTFLHKRSSGYTCTAGPDILDLARFRQLITLARSARVADDLVEAHEHYRGALSLWSGPAGDGWAHGPGAAPIFGALNDEYFQACIEGTGVALAVGKPEQVLPAIHLAAAMAPLHEPVQASLVSLLGRVGLQAEALAVFEVVRHRLADDLGIDPGVALRDARQGVLTQGDIVEPQPIVAHTDVASSLSPSASATRVFGAASALVGRSDEMDALVRAIEPAWFGRTAVVVVEGEPGSGKSRLMEELARNADGRGALVVWGRCMEGDGAPTMWPWVDVMTSLLAALPPSHSAKWLDRELGQFIGSHQETGPTNADGNTRFRLLQQVVEAIADTAADRPVVMMFDDLQWADASSLQLLDSVVARLPLGTAVLAGLRNRGPAPSLELTRTLSAASRAAGHRRLLVGPLTPAEAAELIENDTGVAPPADLAALIHARTAGNPFFVQELGRLLDADRAGTAEGVLASGVPVTVRDVVRDRLAVLDDDTVRLMEVAALIGRNVELMLLARSTSLDVASCLERLEPARALGLIGPTPDDLFSYRYTHDLVRQAVSEAVSPGRAASIHGAIADAIESGALSDESAPERLAHHLWVAGPVTDPVRTVTALIGAGTRATAKTSLQSAERHFGSAVELARKSSLPESELDAISQLIAVVGMRSMYGIASVSLLERAEHVARRLGRDREATGFLFSRWTAHGQGLELNHSTALADQLERLASTSPDPIVKTYGTTASGIHQWCIGNVGESYRRLDTISTDLLPSNDIQERDPVRDGVQLMATGMFAEIAVYHGETARARALFASLTSVAGQDPYAVTVATSFDARAAAVAGDVEGALRAADRGIAADPQFSFTSLGTYLRLARCWGLAMSGHDPAAAAYEADRLIRVNLSSPARTCVSTWYALTSEMYLAAGSLQAASEALDRAEDCLERYGQRSAEGLVILARAQLAHATGDNRVAIQEAERARSLSLQREAHVFADRAERFLTVVQG